MAMVTHTIRNLHEVMPHMQELKARLSRFSDFSSSATAGEQRYFMVTNNLYVHK